MTEHHAMQVKGGCWLGDESSSNGQMSEENSSAVEP